MKKLISILICVLFLQISNAQDSLKHFEFGSTLVTVNSFKTKEYSFRDRPSVEFVNGLFFRYTLKRFGLRLLASYSENSTYNNSTDIGADGSIDDMNNKDIRIGAGGQFAILKHKEWLYTFVDVSYRNVFSTGHYYGGITGASDNISKTANGFDSFFGLGLKIKTVKYVYLSPEFGCGWSTKYVNQTTTPIYRVAPSKSNYHDSDFSLVIKVHVTVKF